MKILFFITTVVFTLGSCNSSTNTNSTNSYKEDQYEKIGHTADKGELPKKAKDFLNAHFTEQKVKSLPLPTVHFLRLNYLIEQRWILTKMAIGKRLATIATSNCQFQCYPTLFKNTSIRITPQ